MENQVSNNKFIAYLKLIQLDDEVKAQHKIKIGAVVTRFDVIKTAGYWKPLESLKNNKGMVYFYLNDNSKIPNESKAKYSLQVKKSCNFSSIDLITPTLNNCLIGSGNPLRTKTYGKDKAINPFYENRNDGFLFLISDDWQTIEILIIKDGLYTIEGNREALANGNYNEALETMRKSATTFYQY